MSLEINFSLVKPELGEPLISKVNISYELFYPCLNSVNCTAYKAVLEPGTYFIELYGASGGGGSPPYRFANNTFLSQDIVKFYKGNAKTYTINVSRSGSGGYTSGSLIVPKRTTFYIHLGGEGVYANQNQKGGYNGGGRSIGFYYAGAGGGATDIRADEDDLFHRVMVSGGGGGCDNAGGTFGGNDDGSGGAGGNLIAQGYFVNGVLVSSYQAKQKTGFSFGNGENGRTSGNKHPEGNSPSAGNDKGGAGGGWFGGFASFNDNGGSGGGSSFALSYDAQYPKGEIIVYDGDYNDIDHGRYAFQKHEFLVVNPTFVAGIWSGNGMARITPISLEHRIPIFNKTCKCRRTNNLLSALLFYIMLTGK